MWDGHRRLCLLLVGAAGVCEPRYARLKRFLWLCACVWRKAAQMEGGGASYILDAVIKYANKSHLRKRGLFGLAVPEG